MVNVVVVGYGFAGRCFHTYLANLAEGMSIYGIATCLLYTSPSPRDVEESRMPSSA